DIISRFRKLRVLCITHSLEYENGSEESAREAFQQPWSHQRIANEIVQYLAEKGSPIQVLAFSPMAHHTKDVQEDYNGHAWSEYFYLRGSSTLGR
ncbi:hypothetical protein EJ02DRAFT_353614, partial [Clathrospora elynae]